MPSSSRLLLFIPLALAGCGAPSASWLAFSPVQRLSQSDLYGDFPSKTIAEGNRTFTPRFELWADGGVKKRWIRLPEWPIDTANPDRWVYPVGTQVWKEFSYQGKRVETRHLEKYDEGSGPMAWGVSVFLWRQDESEADRISHGLPDVAPTDYGTSHDVPSVDDCARCHDSGGDMLLGFTAVELAGAGDGVRLADLIREGRLSQPPKEEPKLPDDPATAHLAGLLHANCAACHNPLSANEGSATGLFMHLPSVPDGDPPFIATGLRKLTQRFVVPDRTLGVDSLVIEPGSAAHSALPLMAARRGENQMPPLATEVADPALAAALSRWIDGLSTGR